MQIITILGYICRIATGILGFIVWVYMAGGVIDWLRQYIGILGNIVGLLLSIVIAPFAIVYPFIDWNPRAFVFLIAMICMGVLTFIFALIKSHYE